MKKLCVSMFFVGASALALGCVGTVEEDIPTAAAESAITDGELDGDDHPGVVLMLAEEYLPDYELDWPAWRCSATLLSPTVVLTAGHCTDGASGGRIFLESDVESGAGVTNNYPFAGPNAVEIASVHTYPAYETTLPWFMADVGVVILQEPVILDEGDYGVLPEVDEYDVLATRRGHQDGTFTAVGYGLQRINPTFVEAELVRMRANPKLDQINGGIVGDFSFLLSNNHATGGTCFGDSGGPNLHGDSNTVAGVTSFGMNGNCAGTGGVFRMDRADVHAWVSSFLD